MVEEDFDIKIQESGVVQPVPEPSRPGHIQAYGGEMLTWVREGAMTGFAIGIVVGIGFYLLMLSEIVMIPVLHSMQVNMPVAFAIMIVLLSGGVGAAGGAVVGIGTPRFNPTPSQGWVDHWNKYILRRKNRDKYIYVPEFKNPQVEAHRRNQRPPKSTDYPSNPDLSRT